MEVMHEDDSCRFSCLSVVGDYGRQRFGTYLSERPTVSLEQAFSIALKKAHAKVTNLDRRIRASLRQSACVQRGQEGTTLAISLARTPFRNAATRRRSSRVHEGRLNNH